MLAENDPKLGTGVPSKERTRPGRPWPSDASAKTPPSATSSGRRIARTPRNSRP